MTKYRTEEDTLGPVQIPADALWGPQTERSRNNFPTGQYMPLAIIRALLNIKKAAAQANMETNAISEEKGNLIVQAIDELLALSDEELRKDFPLKVYQTGSGTQTNMNTNEVVAHKAHQLNPDIEILPNDDVNKGQSSNDTFPTAMNVVALEALDKLKPAVQHLIDELKAKQDKYMKTVKVGRTHLQDAVPLTFGQELSGYVASLEHDLDYIKTLESTLDELAIGGTAVGTGLNAAEGMPEKIAEKLSEVYGLNLTADSNKFYGLANHSGLDVVHGALKTLAADMFKLAQDIRFLASGPRAGYGELNIPANEPGSSIMPGKVNPTQCEALAMVCAQVFGINTTMTLCAGSGAFQLNVYMPIMIYDFVESCRLLADAMNSFTTHCIDGVEFVPEKLKFFVEQSLMIATSLTPYIGYDKSAQVVKEAYKRGCSIKEIILEEKLMTEDEFAEAVRMK